MAGAQPLSSELAALAAAARGYCSKRSKRFRSCSADRRGLRRCAGSACRAALLNSVWAHLSAAPRHLQLVKKSVPWCLRRRHGEVIKAHNVADELSLRRLPECHSGSQGGDRRAALAAAGAGGRHSYCKYAVATT